MVWYFVVGILCLLIGALAGFYGGVAVLKKKMEQQQMSEEEVKIMAKRMGMNLNQKQLAQVTRQMKSAREKDKKERTLKKK